MLTTTVRRVQRYMGFRTRTRRGRVVSAGSPYHSIHQPNGTFLGVLKVAPAQREALAGAAERLAALVDGALPAGWLEELEAKSGRWRLALHRRALSDLEPADDDEGPAEAVEDESELSPADVELSPEDEAELRRRVAAAEQDVPSLLLCGLVRSEVQVGGSHLRKLFWTRPLTPEDVAQAAAEIGGHDEDRALLDSAVKANDGFFTTYFVSPYSKYIARWAARRGWTPNGVSTLSVAVGFAAAAAFATGERAWMIAGAVLLQVAFTLDCVDGQLARYTRTFSKFGGWLDSIFDRTKEYAVFAGLAIGASQSGDDVWLLAGAALTLQVMRHSIDFSYPAAQHQAMGAVRQPPLEQVAGRDPRRRAGRAGARGRAARSAPPPTLKQRLRGAWRRIDRSRRGRWVKKIIAFPIGERFAAISLAAALFDARVTFIVLLAWGGLAASYTIAGRVLRSAGRRGPVVLAPGSSAATGALEAYRDDGPLALALGRIPVAAARARCWCWPASRLPAARDRCSPATARRGRSSPPRSAGSCCWPASRAAARCATACAGSCRPRCASPSTAGCCGSPPSPGRTRCPARSRCCARSRSATTTSSTACASAASRRRAWLNRAAGGWDGRLLAGLALAAAGAVPAGFYVAAALLAVAFVGESIASWMTFGRTQQAPVYEDEEEDAE